MGSNPAIPTIYSQDAFNAETGRVEWQRKLTSPASTSVRASEADVYLGTSDGTMYQLDQNSGAVRGSRKLDPALTPASVPLISGSAVLVLLVDQKAEYRALVSVDPLMARVNWRVAPPDRWSTTRVFQTANTILLGTPSGDLSAYCAADGSSAWSHRLGGAPIRAIGGTEKTLLAGTPQGTLYAIRPTQFCR